jgi:hypothetical protein
MDLILEQLVISAFLVLCCLRTSTTRFNTVFYSFDVSMK